MRVIEFRILCPINFADSSQRTVEGASSLAAMYDAELRLFHVVSARTGDRDAESLIVSLFALTRRLPERTRVSAAIASGDPSSEITQHARLAGSDLIVMGAADETSPVPRLGSTTAYVMVHASCPVLIVPRRFNAAQFDSNRLDAPEAKGLSQ
jgi:nucleotide-binding universal stress UspA family protein